MAAKKNKQSTETTDSDESAAERVGSDEGGESTGDSKEQVDASGISAPSIGPNTVIEREPAEDRLARHEQSDTDAMGLDKRRSVIGGQYSPSIAKQATLYGAFIAVVAALVVGSLILVKELDQPPEKTENEAPWAGNKQKPAPLE